MKEDIKMENLDSERDHHSEKENLSDSDSEQEIDDILDRVPPDFALANKHADANRVK
jgi:hypothetical protein